MSKQWTIFYWLLMTGISLFAISKFLELIMITIKLFEG